MEQTLPEFSEIMAAYCDRLEEGQEFRQFSS